MNSFFEDIKDKKFLNNAELELFPKTNHENFSLKFGRVKKLMKEYEELSNLYYVILPEISLN